MSARTRKKRPGPILAPAISDPKMVPTPMHSSTTIAWGKSSHRMRIGSSSDRGTLVSIVGSDTVRPAR